MSIKYSLMIFVIIILYSLNANLDLNKCPFKFVWSNVTAEKCATTEMHTQSVTITLNPNVCKDNQAWNFK